MSVRASGSRHRRHHRGRQRWCSDCESMSWLLTWHHYCCCIDRDGAHLQSRQCDSQRQGVCCRLLVLSSEAPRISRRRVDVGCTDSVPRMEHRTKDQAVAAAGSRGLLLRAYPAEVDNRDLASCRENRFAWRMHLGGDSVCHTFRMPRHWRPSAETCLHCLRRGVLAAQAHGSCRDLPELVLTTVQAKSCLHRHQRAAQTSSDSFRWDPSDPPLPRK